MSDRLCDCDLCVREGLTIRYGDCHDGCGEPAPISPQTVRKLGYVAGKPRTFIRNHDKRGRGPKYEERDLGYETPCWMFLGYIGPKGYGSMRPHGSKTMRAAHIAFYEAAKGPVPEGKQLDHLCHDPDECPGGPECLHRRCVNPDHLEPVTNRENSYRGQTRPGSKHKPGRKPRPGGSRTFNGAKTHCKNGHPFDAENTYVHPTTGKRTCRTCQSLWHKTNKPWLRRKQ